MLNEQLTTLLRSAETNGPLSNEEEGNENGLQPQNAADLEGMDQGLGQDRIGKGLERRADGGRE